MIALATTTSGVSASLLPGGRTAHSRFNIPLQATDSTMCNISKQSVRLELLQKARLIIWDEAPMAKRYTIESLDRSFRDIMDCPQPFGGKIIIFGGDFRQVLPVLPKGTRQQTVAIGEVTTFKSFDEAMDDTNAYYQEEFLNSLLPNGIPPHKLTLKVNCPIMLLRNLD
ncbi:uncharacterized protein LOC111023820 [Momordica charantia]|uniref:ATP-dependent DNA helicase n=1 Tax=Momordica charantia TaxID=3673 RepID=A0A6J1DWM7_MOMCH|nr:uncharacterized protein LOC111023820 [Momordica charantia]